MPTDWFDAHLDLAYLAELGRDMHAPLASCRGRLLPAAITLDSLTRGRVRACLGTIFTQPIDPADPDAQDGPFAYPASDPDAAHIAGLRQLKLYHAWQGAGLIDLIPPQSSPSPDPPTAAPLRLGVLMEGADPIRSPHEVPFWAEQGVVAVGLAWWTATRYAGGNGTDLGLTPDGRALVHALDQAGIVHDASHLSDPALAQLLDATDRVVIASHSNCRALLEPDNQRHLTDDTIRHIGARSGIVGLNLVRNFIRTGLDQANPNDRPTPDEAVAHVDHVAQIMGHAKGVGLGSDMDGGITASDLPAGINTPSDLPRLTDALASRGWSDTDIEAFAWGNWARFWNLT